MITDRGFALALTERGPVSAADWRDLLASKRVEHHHPIYPSRQHFLANFDWRKVEPVLSKIDPELAAQVVPNERDHRRRVYEALCSAATGVSEINSDKESDDMSTKKAAEKAATKKAATKKEPTGERRGRRSQFGDEAVITVKAEKNPKREGTAGHKAFALYKTGMTVKQFRDKGGRSIDLQYDVKKKYITVG